MLYMLCAVFVFNVIGGTKELKKKLQDVIEKNTPQSFLRRLILFKLISVKDNGTLQYIITQKRGKQIHEEISKFLINKLINESPVYRERFKYFLGYYKDLRSMYLSWNSISKNTKAFGIYIVAHNNTKYDYQHLR